LNHVPVSAPVCASPALTLSDLPRNISAVISHIEMPSQPEQQQLVLRLIEIGFLPGESVRVIAHGHPGREPIAVRLGHTTFALRKHEADFIHVQMDVKVAA
jgi:ferrous iron transport protein A